MKSCYRFAAMGAVVLAVALTAPAGAQPRRGGTLRHAHIGEPPTLDLHWTTATITQDIGVHIYEGLFTLNASYEPRPLLVERWSVSPNRLTFTFHLRQGVLFHHGRELTADDVVASLTRWGRVAARGRELFRDVTSVSASGRYTVEMRLREPNALVPLMLGMPSQGAVIYPREVVEEAGTGMVRRFIGTGPYRFVEHLPDRHIRLDRFDQYRPVDEPASGMAGRREALLDTILFIPTPDPAVRVAGVIRGEYHFADTVPHDEYPRLRGIRGVTPLVIPVANWHGFIFNHRSALMRDRRIRHAFLAALDMEAIMRGTYGPRQFWRLDPGLMPKEHPLWTDAGKELYNQNNHERARTLLAEAGYAGQPVRWLVTTEIMPHFVAASIAKPQLERAGFVIDLQVTDWATVVARRARPELYEVHTTRFGFVPDPTQLLVLLPTWPGWYEHRDMQGMMTLLRRHTEPQVRRDIWRRAQRLFYEDAASVKLGDWFLFQLVREEVKGFTGVPGTHYWNVWLATR
jgi:peptide/nickel transport system substrate-binding protein